MTARTVRRWLAVSAGAALASGALFRAAVLTGVPGYRMAATLLLVATGWGLASAAEAYQSVRALEELERHLAGLAGRLAVLRMPDRWSRRRGWASGYVLVGPGGVMVAAALALSDSARPSGARRRLQAAAGALREAVREVKAALAQPLRPASGGGSPGAPADAPRVPGFGMIFLLRRRVYPGERQRMRILGVGLANAEHVPQVLAPLLQPGPGGAAPLAGPRWEELSRGLARLLGARFLEPASPSPSPGPGAVRQVRP
ncbi:MAG TPA: hypothetical protein VIK90_02295 [Limnochordales bacterium]